MGVCFFVEVQKVQIKVNGKTEKLDNPMSIDDFLKAKALDPNRIVVEVDFQIVHKEKWDSFLLTENAQVEILHFVGGG